MESAVMRPEEIDRRMRRRRARRRGHSRHELVRRRCLLSDIVYDRDRGRHKLGLYLNPLLRLLWRFLGAICDNIYEVSII
jgi:hypothetical protein